MSTQEMLQNPDSCADVLIQIIANDDADSPAITIPLWADYWGGDIRERGLAIAKQLAEAYAYAVDHAITVRCIVNHRVTSF